MSAPRLVPLVDLNPMHWLGDAAKEGVADGFTAMMMSLWSAALWLLQAVFGLLDQFTTPQLDNPGLARLYAVTVGISLIVALVVAFGQLALTAVRRDGRHLATLATGLVQYGAVLTVWIAVCAALVLGCAGLSKALLSELLSVDSFGGYAAGSGWVDHVSGTVEAAVLGVCALFMLIPAALGYLVIMLAREAALLVLVATMPIAAAGALGDTTRAWMWKSVRWFLAACLTAPLLALVLGLGTQIGQAAFPENAGSEAAGSSSTDRLAATQDGRAWNGTELSAPDHATVGPGDLSEGDDDVPDTAANVGLAVVGCVIMLVGCFCPMALFRLLAFVDPGTGSGAAFRSTLAANGGMAGLLSNRRTATDTPTSAQVVEEHGQSAGEASAEAETTTRFSARLARAVPAVGRAAGGALTGLGGIAAQGASLGVDVMGQAGVGHQGYYDTTPARPGRVARTRTGHPAHREEGEAGSGNGDQTPGSAHDLGIRRAGGPPPEVADAAAEDAVFLA